MASRCRIVTDDDRLAAEGRRFVDAMEQRWSRFIESSEISAINRASGSLCMLSAETYRLIELAEAARAETGGAFNALVLDRLERLGYSGDGSVTSPLGPIAVDRVTDEPIELFSELPAVRLPPASRFDPGGIGKGLIGDLTADHLIELGAATAQVELGGDVRLVGTHWRGLAWNVEVRDARDRTRTMARVEMGEGAIATSSISGGSWTPRDASTHHLIDTRTGLPARTDVISVTVIADRLWWAEIVAKVAVMAGSAEAESVLRTHGVTGVITLDDGRVIVIDRALGDAA